ncbi:MAG: hypothetical protein JJ992_18485, partial [Planctomycetes bacterium]|nr:hypothetical protein [Planctomycetota bacterium]
QGVAHVAMAVDVHHRVRAIREVLVHPGVEAQVGTGDVGFDHLDPRFRALAWKGHEYVLGTDAARSGLIADLGDGSWTVTCHDIMAKKSDIVAREATGRFVFDSPDSRAALFHFKRN